jgi:hypothetical protein
MSSMRNVQYEAALQAAFIEHYFRGTYNPETAHLTSETTLLSIWREAVLKLMAPNEREQFLALPEAEQRRHLETAPFFAYERFRAQFLAQALANERAMRPFVTN